MADGGASTMIMLVATLLISGAASAVLIDSWGDVVRTTNTNAKHDKANAETDLSFSGDLGDVELDTSGTNQNITLFFQNSGIRTLDETTLSVFVDGAPASVLRTAVYPTGSVWASNYILEVIVSDSSWSYADANLVSVTAVVKSTVSGGASGTDSATEEVRLSV